MAAAVVKSRDVLCSTEPSAAEGSLHGGAGWRLQEAPTRLPVHRPSALRQAEETGCGVSLWPAGGVMMRASPAWDSCCGMNVTNVYAHWKYLLLHLISKYMWAECVSMHVCCLPTEKVSSTTASGTSRWLIWPFRPSKTASPPRSRWSRTRRSTPWRSKYLRSRMRFRERRWACKYVNQG